MVHSLVLLLCLLSLNNYAAVLLQISIQWDLPWFVDLALWPAYLVENFLKWSVTWMDVEPQAP